MEASVVKEDPTKKKVWTHNKVKGYDHNPLYCDISQV